MKVFGKFAQTALVLLALLAPGCAHERYAGTEDDKAITQSIDTALHRSRGYSYPDVKVSSRDRVVHLNGAVDYQEQKSRAEKIARSIDGVRDVINNVAVRQYPTGRAPVITSPNP